MLYLHDTGAILANGADPVSCGTKAIRNIIEDTPLGGCNERRDLREGCCIGGGDERRRHEE